MPRETLPRKFGKGRDTLAKPSPGDKILAMNAFWNFVGTLLGLGVRPDELTFVQISLRGVVVFIATLIMIRLGHKRSLARKTAFDAVLLVILASVLSRARSTAARHFSRRSVADWCSSYCIACSPLLHFTRTGSAALSKAVPS